MSIAPDIAGLYSEHRIWLTRMAALMLGNVAEAEDAVHDAFTALVRRSDSLRDTDATVAYVRVCVINNVRAVVRRREMVARNASKVGVDPNSAHPAADAGLLLSEDQREVAMALRQLPARMQEILVLRYWSNLSEADIAETLGISKGSVKSTASRALDKLEEILEAGR